MIVLKIAGLIVLVILAMLCLSISIAVGIILGFKNLEGDKCTRRNSRKTS